MKFSRPGPEFPGVDYRSGDNLHRVADTDTAGALGYQVTAETDPAVRAAAVAAQGAKRFLARVSLGAIRVDGGERAAVAAVDGQEDRVANTDPLPVVFGVLPLAQSFLRPRIRVNRASAA